MQLPKLSKGKVIAGVTLTGLIAIVGLGIGVDAFFDRYDLNFQSPIVLRTPVWIEARESKMISPILVEPVQAATPSATPSPTPTAEPKSQSMLKKTQQKPENEGELVGEASFYSESGCMGCDANLIMANGDKLDDAQYTLALPPHIVSQYKLLNDNVHVVNTDNGKEVIAKVTDTGGFYELTNGKRIADLSVATKEALECKSLCQVKITY